MDRLRAWGVLALLAILGGTAAAADPDDSAPGQLRPRGDGLCQWNAGHLEPPKPPPVSPQVAAAKARERDTAAAVRAQEEANLLRRLAACNRLRELAVQTGDESLERIGRRTGEKGRFRVQGRATTIAGGPDASRFGPRAAASQAGGQAMNRFAWMAVLLVGALSGCSPNSFVAPTSAAAKPLEPPRPDRPAAGDGRPNHGGQRAGEGSGACERNCDRDMERAIEASESEAGEEVTQPNRREPRASIRLGRGSRPKS